MLNHKSKSYTSAQTSHVPILSTATRAFQKSKHKTVAFQNEPRTISYTPIQASNKRTAIKSLKISNVVKWNIVTDMSSVSPAKTGAINRTGIDSDARRDELSNLLTREITGFHGGNDCGTDR